MSSKSLVQWVSIPEVHLEMPRITLPEAPGRLTTCKGHSHHGTHTDPPLAPSSRAQHSCCSHGKSCEKNPAAAFCKIKGIFSRSVELKLLAAALSMMWEPRSAPPVPEHSSPFPEPKQVKERHPHTGASTLFVCRAQPRQTDTCWVHYLRSCAAPGKSQCLLRWNS